MAAEAAAPALAAHFREAAILAVAEAVVPEAHSAPEALTGVVPDITIVEGCISQGLALGRCGPRYSNPTLRREFQTLVNG